MNWSDASLSGQLRDQEEVEALVAIIVLDKVGIDDRSWLRIDCSPIFLAEHPLVDPLVDDDKGDWRRSRRLVVKRFQSILELLDLFGNDLISLLLTNTISVDQELVWQFTTMFDLEGLDGAEDASIKLYFDKLLTLWVDDHVTVVFGLSLIGGGSETDHRLLSSMADIDTNDHDLLLHELWPFHSKGLTSHLGVDLLHDVGGYRQVDLLGSILSDTLGQDATFREDLLDIRILVLSIENHDTEVVSAVLGGSLLVLESHDLLVDLIEDLVEISSDFWDLKHLDSLAVHAHLTLALEELTLGVVSLLSAIPIMDHEHNFFGKRISRVDRHLL